MSSLNLHCAQPSCRTFIASGDILMLAIIPPTQNHLAVKVTEHALDKAYETVRKLPQNDPKKSLMCPYKVLCKLCGCNLGSISLIEGNQLICFKMENIFFLNRGYEEIKGKKLKSIKDKLKACGLQVVNIKSQLSKTVFSEEETAFRAPPSEPLVYCDVTRLTRERVNNLTQHAPRDYQMELFEHALYGNSLVFLPTGSGKTLVAAMVLSCMKRLNPKKLMVFITDRVPLVYQQSDYIRSQVPELKVEVLAGDIDRFPGDREQWYNTITSLKERNVDLLVLTHQILLNLMAEENRIVQMSDISMLVFDEAHHCFGNHPYNKIMETYKQTMNCFKPLVLALTASPTGGPNLHKTQKRLETLLENLNANACMPVVSRDLELFWNRPETTYEPAMMSERQRNLQASIERYLENLRPQIERCAGRPRGLEGFPVSSSNYRGALRKLKELCNGDREKVNDNEEVKGLALTEHAMHMLGALELNSILGHQFALECLQECLAQMERSTSPWEKFKSQLLTNSAEFSLLTATVNSLRDVFFLSSSSTSDRYEKLIHELTRFLELNKRDTSCRGIVFVKMRKTADKLCERLRKNETFLKDLNPMFFVGHGRGSDGMAWFGEQEEVLKKFRSGKSKLLISTSVLEEGLDVPVCNLVIRFDSSITLRSLVQGRGRAARRPDSRFVVICSDLKEQEAALRAITEEQFMEQAMRIEQGKTSYRLAQADKFGCEVRVLETTTKISGNDCPGQPIGQSHLTLYHTEESQQQARYKEKKKRQFTPKIRVKVCNVSTQEGSKDISEAVAFLEENYEVNSSTPSRKKPTSDIGSEEVEKIEDTTSILFEIEPSDEHQHGFQSKERFFRHVAEAWCSREKRLLPGTKPSQMWLVRTDPSRDRSRKPVHILPCEDFSIGYFLNRVHYGKHWRPAVHAVRLVFEHDFKRLLIYFSTDPDLYKIEIRYSEMEETVLVDKRRECHSSDLFFLVRHPPRLFRAYQLVDGGDDEELDDFEDWYDRYDQDEGYEETEGFMAFDVDYDSDYEDSQQNDVTTDEEEEDDANLFEPLALFGDGNLRRINDVVNWERVVDITDSRRLDSAGAFGECFTYKFNIPERAYADFSHLLTTLQRFDKKVYYAQIETSERPLPVVRIPLYLPFDVIYATECLLSAHPASRGRMSDTGRFKTLLHSENEKEVLVALEQLSSILERDKFCDPVPVFEALLKQKHLRSSAIPSKLLPSQCALIKRLVITPTRLLLFTAEIMSKNRVLRNYNTEHFICINIRDEDFSKISAYSGKISKLLQRARTVLEQGVWLGNHLFQYLGCSNSQLRNHSCWFVRRPPPPEEIRAWMGDFTMIRCVGTFVARMGQCFSTSMDTVGIDVNEGASWEEDYDVKTPDEKYCFSDGVGRISVTLAKQVARKMAKEFNPSAFQIRFAGFKGVLAVDPRLLGKTAHLRPSMRKFQSPHRRLEVLQTSRAQDVYLNHQVIMLLSNLGVPDKVFMELQRRMMDNLAGMLVDEKLAIQQLSSGAKTGVAYANVSNMGLALTVEPYFKALLGAVYRDRIQNLLSKARILLPREEARLMLGVMDETGILEPGQVFAQYSAVNTNPDRHGPFAYGQKCTLTGQVIVTRNPCLHPGDVRLLQAVDVPQLRHHVDCVVFPRRGERPHPSQMAGGDLDGDLYFVCWYKDLLPTKPEYEPMNYEALPKKEVDHPITVNDMIEFVVDYIRFDQLGIIDNAHKAHADKEEKGVESEICLKLAELHSLAVDAPKTGKWPEMPAGARVEEYPDFMMKTDKPNYPSQKVLGKLYRECRSFKETIEGGPRTHVPCLDHSLLVPGFQQYVEAAREIYEEYTEQLKTIMNLYGIESEAELLTGCYRRLSNRLGREKADIADVVSRVLHVMRVNFRNSFFEEFGLDGSSLSSRDTVTDEMKQKASSWYYVAYLRRDNADTSHDTTAGAVKEEQPQYLSFPWLIDDVMLSLISERNSAKHQSPTVACSISQSLMDFFEEEKKSLLEGYRARMRIKSLVSGHLAKENPRDHELSVALFGSSANFLFRDNSDIDLCVVNARAIAEKQTLSKQQQLIVLRRLRPAMKKLFRFTRLVENARVPVIACKTPNKKEINLTRRTACDLSASWDGLLKAIIVANYIKSYPGLLPILRLILKWGHDSRLTGHGEHDGTNTTVMVFLVLVFCVYQRYVRNFDEDGVWATCLGISTGQVTSQEMYGDWERVVHNLDALTAGAMPTVQRSSAVKIGHVSIGEALLSFFRMYNMVLDVGIPEPFAGFLGVSHVAELLDPERLRMLREHMQRAFHILALHGDVKVLLSLSKSEVHRVIFLTGALSYTMMGSESHNARELSKSTGAKVTVRPRLPGSGFGLVLEAVGTEMAVRAVENALDVMTTQAIRNRASIMSQCFVQGANQMLFECCHSDDDYITLVPYYGDHHPTHDGCALYVPMMSNPPRQVVDIGSAFMRQEFASFKENFQTQLEVVRRDHVISLHGPLEFAVHFGRIYTFSLPKSFTEDTEQVTVKKFQATLKRSYKALSAFNLPGRIRTCRPKYSAKFSKKKGKKKKNTKSRFFLGSEEKEDKKKRKEKPSRSSFFTVIRSKEKLELFLQARGFRECESFENVVVDVRTDHEFAVKFGTNFDFQGINFPKLRWSLTDVKRNWKESPPVEDSHELDGVETDVRLMLLSRRALGSEEIQGTDYDKYRGLLEPKPRATHSGIPFKVKQEVWKDVVLIRQKKAKMFRLDPQLAHSASEFMSAMTIKVAAIMEYSRPTRHASAFNKAFERYEVSLHPALPSNWTEIEVEQFLRNIWAFSFALSSYLAG